jgi:hypothetical protein
MYDMTYEKVLARSYLSKHRYTKIKGRFEAIINRSKFARIVA